jgi:hypothetical protein
VHVLTCEPQFPHAWDSVAPGAQMPWPTQAPKVPQVQELVHVRVCVPQLPQANVSINPGVQTPVGPGGHDGNCPSVVQVTSVVVPHC